MKLQRSRERSVASDHDEALALVGIKDVDRRFTALLRHEILAPCGAKNGAPTVDDASNRYRFEGSAFAFDDPFVAVVETYDSRAPV